MSYYGKAGFILIRSIATQHNAISSDRANRGPDDESEEETEDESSEEETKSGSGSGSEEESSSEEDENKKKKGVSGLIETENPNHVRRKTTQKVTKVDVSGASGSSKPELSRREREELDKQRAAANYQKLHAEGKTEQARADLARLAIIKQHRAEAAARREQEKKGECLILEIHDSTHSRT